MPSPLSHAVPLITRWQYAETYGSLIVLERYRMAQTIRLQEKIHSLGGDP